MDKLFIIFVATLVFIPIFYSMAVADLNAEISRQTTSDVVSDDLGIISLTPNSNSNFVTLDSNGELSISTSNTSANALNTNTILDIGDTQSPQNTAAFTVQNLTSTSISLTFTLTPKQSFTGATDSTEYIIETNNSIQRIQVGESATVSISNAERIFVSVQFDTTNESENTSLDTQLQISGGSNA